MPTERLDSLDDPRLDAFRSLKMQNTVRDSQVFIAEGATVVDRVLQSTFEVRSILISDRKWAAFQHRLPTSVPVYRLSNELSAQLVGFPFHCGVMAAVQRKPDPPWSAIVPRRSSSLIMAGDRIVDPENVGALIRIARAFGADAVLLSAGSADAFSRRVLRVSMGNVLFLPILETADLASSLLHLQTEHHYSVCAATLDENSTNLAEFRFSARSVIVVGNEFDGISREVQAQADHQLTIPMSSGTDSLNVAIATGIFAWRYQTHHEI